LEVKNTGYPLGFRLVRLLVIIVIAVFITALLIIFPGPGSSTSSFYSNWTINIAVITAVGISSLSTATAYRTTKLVSKHRYRHDGAVDVHIHENEINIIDRAKHHFYTCFSLTAGLVLWVLAELTWTYYQLGLGVENPFPSIADTFWLAGYPFIIYFTYGMNKAFSKDGFYDREALIMLSVSAALTLGYIFNLTFGVADIMSAAEDEVGWLINILYPILDTIALIPSLTIVASFSGRRNRSAYSIHWLLLAISIIILTIADIGFDYSEVLGKAEEEQWFWDTLFASSYLVMAGALYAYNSVLSMYRQKAETILHEHDIKNF